MAKFYSFNIEKVKKQYINIAIPIMEKACDDLYSEIQENSPVDTGYYLSKHIHKWVRQEWNTLIAEVENIGKYPEKVEGGWRKTPVNWHLRNWKIYNSIGAETYQNSLNKVWKNLIDKLK